MLCFVRVIFPVPPMPVSVQMKFIREEVRRRKRNVMDNYTGGSVLGWVCWFDNFRFPSINSAKFQPLIHPPIFQSLFTLHQSLSFWTRCSKVTPNQRNSKTSKSIFSNCKLWIVLVNSLLLIRLDLTPYNFLYQNSPPAKSGKFWIFKLCG